MSAELGAVLLAQVFECLLQTAQDKRNADLVACLGGSGRAAVITGTATLVGVLALGPVGILAGSVTGGLIAYLTSDDFKPLAQVLQEMPKSEQTKLIDLFLKKVKHSGNRTSIASLVGLPLDTRSKFLIECLKDLGIQIARKKL